MYVPNNCNLSSKRIDQSNLQHRSHIQLNTDQKVRDSIIIFGLIHRKVEYFSTATPAQLADTTTYLLTQQTSRAGFDEDGSFAPSVKNAIINELEKGCSIVLGYQYPPPWTEIIMNDGPGKHGQK